MARLRWFTCSDCAARRRWSSRSGAARPRERDAGAGAPRRARDAAEAAVPRGLRAGDRRDGLLLGRRARVLAGARRVHDGGRLRRRLHAQPDLRGGLLRAHRPHRGGAGRVRPGQDLATRRSCGCSGRTTTRPRACARATTSAPSTARRSTGRPRSSARWPRRRATPSPSACGPPATRRSRPRSRRPGPFYYAEDYHQQYLEKNPWGYCGLGGTGVSCPVGLGATSARASARPPRAEPHRRPRLARAGPRPEVAFAPCTPRADPATPSSSDESVTSGGDPGHDRGGGELSRRRPPAGSSPRRRR